MEGGKDGDLSQDARAKKKKKQQPVCGFPRQALGGCQMTAGSWRGPRARFVLWSDQTPDQDARLELVSLRQD